MLTLRWTNTRSDEAAQMRAQGIGPFDSGVGKVGKKLAKYRRSRYNPRKSHKQAEGTAQGSTGSQNQTCLSGQVAGGGTVWLGN